MSGRKDRGTYVSKLPLAGSGIVKTIVTPAGTFRALSQDVLDHAKRSANTTLKREIQPLRGTEDRNR